MDEQMFCFQCEQAAGCTACTGAAGVCGKSAETAAAQDRLTGALIAFAGQLIAAGRGPAPEQARLLMQGLFTTITNVNFDPAAVDALTRRVHDASPGTGPDYDMQALWREPDADRRSLKCFVLFSLRGMAAYNYHARVLGRSPSSISREIKRNTWFPSNENESYRPYRPRRLKAGPWTGRYYIAGPAQRKADRRRSKPRKPCRLSHDRLWAQVAEWLGRGWSPLLISGRLRVLWPDDALMRVCPETIYRWVYSSRPLRERWARCLPRGHRRRRRHGCVSANCRPQYGHYFSAA